MIKLSAKDLGELLNFYLSSAEGVKELRANEDREVVLAPLIDRKLLRQTSERSDMYGHTAGYSITKAGRIAIETALDVFDETSHVCIKSDPPVGISL